MANLDTPAKRSSALDFEEVWSFGLPLPDGTIDQADRQALIWSYSGLLIGTGAQTYEVTLGLIRSLAVSEAPQADVLAALSLARSQAAAQTTQLDAASAITYSRSEAAANASQGDLVGATSFSRSLAAGLTTDLLAETALTLSLSRQLTQVSELIADAAQALGRVLAVLPNISGATYEDALTLESVRSLALADSRVAEVLLTLARAVAEAHVDQADAEVALSLAHSLSLLGSGGLILEDALTLAEAFGLSSERLVSREEGLSLVAQLGFSEGDQLDAAATLGLGQGLTLAGVTDALLLAALSLDRLELMTATAPSATVVGRATIHLRLASALVALRRAGAATAERSGKATVKTQ